MTVEKVRDIMNRFYDAIDENRFDDMHAMLAPEAEMHYANFPVLAGRDKIRDLFNSIKSTRISAKHHSYDYFIKSENEWIITCKFDQVQKTPAGDVKTISLPAAAEFAQNAEGLLTLYRIYMDPSPTTIVQGKALVPDSSYDVKTISSGPQ